MITSRQESSHVAAVDRRSFMACCAALGLGATALPALLWARAQEQQRVTAAMIAEAEKVAGLELTAEEREQMANSLSSRLRAFEQIRALDMPNAVPPALHFDPTLPGMTFPLERRPLRYTQPAGVQRPADLEEVAFWPVTRLAELVRTRQVLPSELTEMYLARLRRHDLTLLAVVTLTEERARAQARTLDDELRAGRYRGPLHGIPWGAKDLLAVRGYPTTWGATPYRGQTFAVDATVVQRLVLGHHSCDEPFRSVPLWSICDVPSAWRTDGQEIHRGTDRGRARRAESVAERW